MRTITLFPLYISAALLAVGTATASAQDPDSETRAAVIEEAEAQKVTTLQPYVPTRGERTITKVQKTLVNPSQTWHPFFENAYHGGGFAAGLGYMWHVSPYNYVDVRGSYSIRSYKRAEVEFDAPRLFHRRGELTVGAGWRDATEVGFYGLGMDTASQRSRELRLRTSRRGALLTVRPTRRLLLLRGGLDFSRWDMKSGTGGRSVEDVYTPETLTGLGATTTYLALSRNRRVRLATVVRLRPPGRVLRRHRARLPRLRRSLRVRSARLRSDPAHSDPARELGPFAACAGRRRRGAKAISRSRSSCCRRSAADPICAAIRAGASATATACCCRRSGESWPTASSTRAVFYDAGKVAAHKADLDLQRPEDRLRLRRPLPCAVCDRAAHRHRQEPRGDVSRVFDVSSLLRACPPCASDCSSLPRSCFTAALHRVGAARPPGPRFYPDDPIARVPESQDASQAGGDEIGDLYEMTYNLFVQPGYKPSGRRAQNINTIDEVPDSSWFTNRIGARPVSIDEVVRGPIVGARAGSVALDRRSGKRPPALIPGFTARDAKGETWFLEFDPDFYPEGATAAVVMATKIFWALGYNQVESFLTTFDPKHMDFDPKATIRRPNGKRTRFTRDDIDEMLRDVARKPDGSYRVIAGRLLPGKVIGNFRYSGTRPDDPNDLVPHEHRRELRALRVFGAWTNLTDLKAANTLDTLVTENGRSIVKHCLQDVGSTFGMCNDLHEWDLSWEHFIQGDTTMKRLVSFGFALEPVADGGLRRGPVDRQVRRRSLRSAEVAAADADRRLHGVAGRRRVLGGAARRRVQRRDDSSDRPHRPIQRSGGGESDWRHPDQAARQDPRRISAGGESNRRAQARERPADVRECCGGGARGQPASELSCGVGRVRQRDRRDPADRRDDQYDDDDHGAGWTSERCEQLHRRERVGRESGARGVAEAGANLLPSNRRRLAARRARAPGGGRPRHSAVKRIRLDEYLAGCSQDGGHVQHDVPVVVARRRLPIP